jgi:allantoinase
MENCGNDVVMPGLIDSHVHINEPGRTEWEGFLTATKAAAAGGITTLVDMPLNSSPVSVSSEKFQEKINAAKGKMAVHCGFWGGLIPNNIESLEGLIKSGVLGIKAFLTHSGIDEFPNVCEQDLREALPILKKHNSLLLVHCELDSEHSGQQLLEKEPTSYKAYLASRPKEWEDKAIELMIKLCEEFKVRTHVVHLSSANSIEQIKIAKEKGLPISVETCPHYLYFNAEDVPDGKTEYKCAPPIREKTNNDQLWDAIKKGVIEFIVTDHSPAPPEMKELISGDFIKAWGGIAGLQFSLPVVWTKAKENNITIEKISNLMSSNIAKFLGLDHLKGKLQKGYDADITIWNPEKKILISKSDILHRHSVTPYVDEELYGELIRTYVNGEIAYEKKGFNNAINGEIILKQ